MGALAIPGTRSVSPTWLRLKNALRRHPTAIVGAAVLALMIVIALCAPWLGTVDPEAVLPLRRLKPPSAEYWFGSDMLGRDVYSRVVYGARVSLAVGLAVALLSTAVGLAIGLVTGYLRWVDAIVMRIMDGLMSIPSVLLAIALMALTKASIGNVIVAITLAEVPRVVRLVRSLVLTLREQPYVEAAVAAGTTLPRILTRHILPNTVAPLLVQATYVCASAMITEAILSFIGAGTPPNIPSWGNIMAEARSLFQIAGYLIFFPGVCLSLTVLAINLLGDGMRDALDPAAGEADVTALLEVDDLRTYFYTRDGVVRAVDGVSFSVNAGETLAVVGESGCGKSVTSLSILRLIASPPGRIVSGRVTLEGREFLALTEREMRGVRGNEISMIFQEPMTSLNPVLTVGRQIAESVEVHRGLSSRDARKKAIDMLALVNIPEPERRVSQYPHELSGGMRQRVMIAMALACGPRLLIADEPTTALDVTIQAQILTLMRDLKDKTGAAIVLITHDLGVVAEMAQRVVVMYAGRKVEEAAVEALFERPLHPYTVGLLQSVPRLGEVQRGIAGRLAEIPGTVPSLRDEPVGCTFAPRCPYATDVCHREYPPLEMKAEGHYAACWHSDRVRNSFPPLQGEGQGGDGLPARALTHPHPVLPPEGEGTRLP